MTAPIVPPTGRDPAGPGQREAARDYLTRIRQQGGTYRVDRRRGRAVARTPSTPWPPVAGEHNPARPPPCSR